MTEDGVHEKNSETSFSLSEIDAYVLRVRAIEKEGEGGSIGNQHRRRRARRRSETGEEDRDRRYYGLGEP